jgi:hypothetical protein
VHRVALVPHATAYPNVVVHSLMERKVDEVVGPKHKRNPDRMAKRQGHEACVGGDRLGRAPFRIANQQGLRGSADDRVHRCS